jgi:hypothetical protein
MASFAQMEAIGKLVEQGWKVLGPADNTMGGRTLMEDKEGKKFYVGGCGEPEPAPDDAKPVELRPPPVHHHDLGGEG